MSQKKTSSLENYFKQGKNNKRGTNSANNVTRSNETGDKTPFLKNHKSNDEPVTNFKDKIAFIWANAELLRGTYKQADYGKIILPFTVLKRLDSVLVPTKKRILEECEKSKDMSEEGLDLVLKNIAQHSFYNKSKFVLDNLDHVPDKQDLGFGSLKDDPDKIEDNLINYINGFSKNAREIMERFNIRTHIAKLQEKNLLYLIVSKFVDDVDLHPDKVSNVEMGYIYEELIRRFAELSNETAGHHFTPREVIRLMVNLLFIEDKSQLSQKGLIKTLFDPACGTGGMLSVSEDYLRNLNPDMRLIVFGQELNDESFAICKSDMMIKGQKPENIKLGNSFSEDQFSDQKFDYMLCNPPFGVEWKNVQKFIVREYEKLGKTGRFGAGLPRVNDGSLLFLQHMLSKMKKDGEGTRLVIVFNGSPLFTGSAGSGESEIRKWIIENDWLEAIIALPEQLFYNTGIFTYIFVLSNRKTSSRRDKVQLINTITFFEKMKKSLGDKRNYISDQQIAEITRIYGEFRENQYCKIFDNEDFGYYEVTVEQPLRLNFQLTEERINKIWEEKSFLNLAISKKKKQEREREIKEGKQLQQNIIQSLKKLGQNNNPVLTHQVT